MSELTARRKLLRQSYANVQTLQLANQNTTFDDLLLKQTAITYSPLRKFYAKNTIWVLIHGTSTAQSFLFDQPTYVYKLSNTGKVDLYKFDPVLPQTGYNKKLACLIATDDEFLVAEVQDESFQNSSTYLRFIHIDHSQAVYKAFNISEYTAVETKEDAALSGSYPYNCLLYPTFTGGIGVLLQFYGVDPVTREAKSVYENLHFTTSGTFAGVTYKVINGESRSSVESFARARFGHHMVHTLDKENKKITTKLVKSSNDSTLATDVMYYDTSSMNVSYVGTIYAANGIVEAERQDDTDWELFGNQFIGGAFLEDTDGYMSILFTRNKSGTINSVRIDGVKISQVLAVGPSGDIWLITEESYVPSLRRYSASGELLWTMAKVDYDKLTPNINIMSYIGAFYSGTCRFDEEGNISFSIYQLYRGTIFRNVSVVVSKENGHILFVSNTSAITIPKYSGYVTAPLTEIEYYDEATDTAEIRLFAINTKTTSTSSTLPEVGTPNLLFGAIPKQLYVKCILVTEDGSPIPSNWSIDFKIYLNGSVATKKSDSSFGGWYSEAKEGQSYKIAIETVGYEATVVEGTVSEDLGILPVVVKRIAWDRKTYYIRTPQDLQDMRNDPIGNYIVCNDIDMAGFAWEPMYTDKTNPFLGTFDGGGYTISNLYCSSNGSFSIGGLGFIGYAQNATFKDVVFDSCTVEGYASSYTALLVAHMQFKYLYSDDQQLELVRPFVHNVKITNSRIVALYAVTPTGFLFGGYTSDWTSERLIPALFDGDSDKAMIDSCIVKDSSIVASTSGGYNVGGFIGVASIY